MNEGNLAIRFHCKNCGQKITVKEVHAGKKSKCPKCKTILVVPNVQTTSPAPAQSTSTNQSTASKDSAYDLSLLDVSQKDTSPSEPASQQMTSELALEDQIALLTGRHKYEPEPPPERKLPWIIDVFLYPINRAGITILAITIGVPLAIDLLVKFLRILTLRSPLLLIFLVLFLIIHWTLEVLFALYMFWYIWECIRDSGMGGLRAPETLGSTPGLDELFLQIIRIIICLAFFTLPVLIYFLYSRRVETIFWLLYGCSVLLFPMGLLAVIKFDSLRALNPVLVIGSIFSTFFQYSGLVILFYILSLLVPTMVSFLPWSWILFHITKLASFYLVMVASHLLGRFYWRYQEKLNWEV